MATKSVKAPQDRQPKEEKVLRPQEVPGWDLLRPFEEIPVWEQTPLISMLQEATQDSDELSDEEYAALSPNEKVEYDKNKDSIKSFDVNIIGRLAFQLKSFAVDEEAYTKFCSGRLGMSNAMNLAMAWVGQMGESESSENS